MLVLVHTGRAFVLEFHPYSNEPVVAEVDENAGFSLVAILRLPNESNAVNSA
jgi:hypothetical protein